MSRLLGAGIVAAALAASVGAWRAHAQGAELTYTGVILGKPGGPRDVKITLGQVREIQMALASIETRDGKAVPTCLGDIKPPCIPLALSSAIADDLAALSLHWQFYQAQAHKLIGDASGGTGYIAPGSREETVANYRLFDLNGQQVTVRVRPVDVNGLEASGVQVPPTIKAVLAPVTR